MSNTIVDQKGFLLIYREKGRDLTLSCYKNPYTHRTIQKAMFVDITEGKILPTFRVFHITFSPFHSYSAGGSLFVIVYLQQIRFRG